MLLGTAFLASSLFLGLALSRKVFNSGAWLYSLPLGIAAGAWTLYLSSLAAGFGPLSIAVSCVANCVVGLLLSRKPFHFEIDLRDAAFFALAFSASLAAGFALLHFDSGGNLVGFGTDLGFYLGMTSSIGSGVFPPQYGVAAGEPLSYYYFLFLFEAGLYAGGFPLVLAYNLAFAMMVASSLSVAFFLGRTLFRSAVAGALVVALLLFACGLSFVPYLEGADLSNPSVLASLFSQPDLLLQFQSRGFPVQPLALRFATSKADWAGLAFFLFFAGFAPFGRRERDSMLIAGAVAGMSLAFNLPLAVLTLTASFFLFVLFERRRVWLGYFGAAAVLGALSLPIFLSKAAAANSSFLVRPFWFAQGSPIGAAAFWLSNFGFVVALAAIGFSSSPTALRRLSISLLPFFAVVNLASFFPWAVDNFKFAIPFQAAFAFLAAGGAMKLWARPFPSKAFCASLVALAAFGGVLTAFSIAHFASVTAPARPICPAQDVRFADWAGSNTPPGSVFAADEYADSSCLTALSGRLAFFSDMKWIENHGLERTTRRETLGRILSGDCAAIRSAGIGYFYEDLGRGWRIHASAKAVSTLAHADGKLSAYRITGCKVA